MNEILKSSAAVLLWETVIHVHIRTLRWQQQFLKWLIILFYSLQSRWKEFLYLKHKLQHAAHSLVRFACVSYQRILARLSFSPYVCARVFFFHIDNFYRFMFLFEPLWNFLSFSLCRRFSESSDKGWFRSLFVHKVDARKDAHSNLLSKKETSNLYKIQCKDLLLTSECWFFWSGELERGKQKWVWNSYSKSKSIRLCFESSQTFLSAENG